MSLRPPLPRADAEPATGLVLVVDDSLGMRETLSEMLRPYWKVEVAADVPSALAKAREARPDLVLVDLVMPGSSGLDFLRALRADPATASAGVVMLSGRAGPEDVVAGLEAGADGYLAKPFTAAELIARVRTHMNFAQARGELEQRVSMMADLLERLQVAQRSQAFLLSAAQVLARATGYEETLRNLAAVAVPTLGDVCLIDVVDEEQGLRRVAARHMDPERQPLVDLLGELYPPDVEGEHPAAQVLREPASISSEHVEDAFLRRTSRDEEHFRLVKELGFTSFMTVPLADRGQVLGAMTLVSAGSGRRFGAEDLSLAEALAGQVAAVVAKARRYEEEHAAAHTLQSSLLPADLPEIPGLAVAVRYLPGSRGAEVGGDWYDVVAHPSGATVLAVGDVAGHDIGAAAAMGAVRAGLRALVRHAEEPASLLELLQFSWDDLGVERMATLVVVFIDGATGAYSVGSAGHPPPLVISGGGRADFLPLEATTPLGAPPLPVRVFQGELGAADLMLLYTDGLIETRDASLEAGMADLARVGLESRPPAPGQPGQFCSRVLSRLGRVRSDDVALLAAARRPA